MTANPRPGAEGIVQVLILFAVAGMAGAASFTHVHDWTMRNVPAGTGTWFGWANAIITELVPLACGLEVRRRKRQHRPATYPMTILITDAAVSLAAQLSDAIHTLAGSLAVALPALAFLALTKLILTRPRPETPGETECASTAPKEDASGQPGSPGQATTVHALATNGTASSDTVRATQTPRTTGSAPISSTPHRPTVPATAGDLTASRFRDLQPIPSGQLIMSARMTAFAYERETGRPITPGELAERLGVPLTLAESLLDHSGTAPAPLVTAANGTPRPKGANRP